MSARPVGILKDMNMKCERLEAPECTPEFIHSVSDQERYIELKLDSLPKGCNACRKWRAEKAAKAGRSKPCPEFRQDGKCQFGDQCRYSHNITPMSAHLIQQDPADKESEVEAGIMNLRSIRTIQAIWDGNSTQVSTWLGDCHGSVSCPRPRIVSSS